jgi:hypothetical protein
MDDKGDIEIDFDAIDKVVADANGTDIRVEDAPEEAPVEVSAEDGLAEFKRKYEDERAARIDAERRAQAASEQVHRASNEVDDTNLRLVESAINTIKNDSAALKARYRDAMSAGDFDHAAEVQEAMSHNAARLLQLENGKQAMENRPRQAPPPAYTDPVEAFASQLTPQSASWERKHPEFVTNPRLNQKMIAAHNLAMADGVEADTPEYFGYVEGILGVRASSGNETATSAAAAPTQRRASPPAAPVSRNGTGTGSRPNVVRLTADEREMASLMGQTPEEYAKNKIALVKAGKILN